MDFPKTLTVEQAYEELKPKCGHADCEAAFKREFQKLQDFYIDAIGLLNKYQFSQHTAEKAFGALSILIGNGTIKPIPMDSKYAN